MSKLATEAFIERLEKQARLAENLRAAGRDSEADRVDFHLGLAVFMARSVKP